MAGNMNTDSALERLLDSDAAGQFFGVTGRTVRNLVTRGVLPVVLIPGSRGYRFRMETLREIAQRYESPMVPTLRNREISSG